MNISKREFLKLSGTSAALAALGSSPGRAESIQPAPLKLRLHRPQPMSKASWHRSMLA